MKTLGIRRRQFHSAAAIHDNKSNKITTRATTATNSSVSTTPSPVRKRLGLAAVRPTSLSPSITNTQTSNTTILTNRIASGVTSNYIVCSVCGESNRGSPTRCSNCRAFLANQVDNQAIDENPKDNQSRNSGSAESKEDDEVEMLEADSSSSSIISCSLCGTSNPSTHFRCKSCQGFLTTATINSSQESDRDRREARRQQRKLEREQQQQSQHTEDGDDIEIIPETTPESENPPSPLPVKRKLQKQCVKEEETNKKPKSNDLSSSSSSTLATASSETEPRRRTLREAKKNISYTEEKLEDESPFSFVELKWYSKESEQPFRLNVSLNVHFLLDVHAHLAETEIIGILAGFYTKEKKDITYFVSVSM